MKAMILERIQKVDAGSTPLQLVEIPKPVPGKGELLVRVLTCGVCHTELDEIEGRTKPAGLPRILGHQVVGVVEATGINCQLRKTGDRVGVGWIFSACGHCEYCRSGNENLCSGFQATGRDVDGGYAEYMVVPEASAYLIPESLTDLEAAPLLCAGAIGYRSLRLTNLKNGKVLGLLGFGASAHLVLKTVRHILPKLKVFVFTRNTDEQEFARELGADWAGGIDEPSPEQLHAVIDTTPVWKPVVAALLNLRPGGRMVINAIRKENSDRDSLQELDYANHLWMEKEIKSVANVSRRDIQDFLEIAAAAAIKPETQEYTLEDANLALISLRQGGIKGGKVLRVSC